MALVGGYAGYAEVAPYLDSVAGPAQRLADLAAGLPLPVSEASRAALVRECYAIATSTLGRAQPTTRRVALLQSCRSMADEIWAAAPSVGLVPTLSAEFSADLHDKGRFNADLARSFLAAPNEQWLAEVRVQVVEANFDLASAATIDLERKDLSVLVRSRRGIASIARRYIEHPEFRERVTAVVENLSEADQARFVAEVKRAASEAG
jgi:hypothetical protein